MEFMTLVFIILTSLICGALAAASLGFRPANYEQSTGAESLQGDRTRGEQKKKKTKKQKKNGSKKTALEESDEEDDSMPDEDVAVGLLHARGITLKTTETMNKSPRAGQKEQATTKTTAMGKISKLPYSELEEHVLLLPLALTVYTVK